MAMSRINLPSFVGSRGLTEIVGSDVDPLDPQMTTLKVRKTRSTNTDFLPTVASNRFFFMLFTLKILETNRYFNFSPVFARIAPLKD